MYVENGWICIHDSGDRHLRVRLDRIDSIENTPYLPPEGQRGTAAIRVNGVTHTVDHQTVMELLDILDAEAEAGKIRIANARALGEKIADLMDGSAALGHKPPQIQDELLEAVLSLSKDGATKASELAKEMGQANPRTTQRPNYFGYLFHAIKSLNAKSQSFWQEAKTIIQVLILICVLLLVIDGIIVIGKVAGKLG